MGAAKWFHFSLSSDDDLDEWEIGKREVWQSGLGWRAIIHGPNMGVAKNESHLQFATDHRNYSAPLLGIIGQIGFSQNSKQFTIYYTSNYKIRSQTSKSSNSIMLDQNILYCPNCYVAVLFNML